MNFRNLVIVFFLISPISITPSLSCNNIGKGFAKEAAREVSIAAVQSAEDLKKSLDDASAKLSDAMGEGIDATRQVVAELSTSISDLARSVSVKINSADFENLGKAATESLRDAVDKLSQNWNLSLDTADMKDFGAEASKNLGEALQNINIKLSLMISVAFDDNVVRAVGYASIALGIAFSVLFIAIVVSLKSCRKCTVSLFTACVGVCRSNNLEDGKSKNTEGEEESGFNKNSIKLENNRREPVDGRQQNQRKLLDDSVQDFTGDTKVYNELVEKRDRKKERESLAGFTSQKFSNLKNFWSTQEEHSSF